MQWRKLKKVLAEHPYLLDDAFQMPLDQAMALQEQEGYPSFDEIVAMAKLRSSAPASAWAPVDAVLARHQRGQISLANLWMRPLVRVALIGLCILLFASYLSFAPSGRALAASFVKIVLQVAEDGFRFTPVSTPEATSSPDKNAAYAETIQNFPDFDAVEKATGRQLLRFEGSVFTLESLTLYDNSLSGVLLSATYKTPEGLNVYLQQEWKIDTSVWGETNPDEIVWEEAIFDGTVLYCFIGSESGTFTATTAWRDEIITVYAEKGVPYKNVIQAIAIKE